MDNVTHTLFALTLARTQLGRAGRGTTTALVLASSAPDIDIVTSARGAVSYLQWHRGPTHGPLGVVGLGLLTAAVVWGGRTWWDKRHPGREGPPDASLGMLIALSMLAIVFHIAMDLPTSYGTRFLSPFDWHWYGVDWMPIVDVYLLIALATGLLLGAKGEAARRRNATLILLFMTANYGLRAAGHHQALELAPRLFGPVLPRPCDVAERPTSGLDRWPRNESAAATASHDGTDGSAQPSRCLVEIAAMPNFTSPFRWRVIAQLSDAYELHDVDLLDSRFSDPASIREAFWRLSLRYPDQWTPSVFQAATTRVGQIYLGFSRFPAARSIVDQGGFATVRFSDMRFVGGAVGLDQPAVRTNLFTARIRIAPDGTILLQQFGP
jgi:membrane-bound metal-dependent hydrolase YbcI (DUF457 family)